MLAGMCIQRQKIISYNCDIFNQIKGMVTERLQKDIYAEDVIISWEWQKIETWLLLHTTNRK